MPISQTNSVMKGKIINVLRAVQLAFLLIALSTIADTIQAPSFAFAIRCLASVAGAILLIYPIYLVKCEREALAIGTFLTIGVCTLFLLIFAGGGMYSVSMTALPLALIYSALFAQFRIYWSLFLFMFLGILFIGLNNIHGWFFSGHDEILGDWLQLKDGMIIIVLTGYVTWLVGSELKKTFRRLLLEKEEVARAKLVIEKLANTDVLTGLSNRHAAKAAFERLSSDLDQKTESIAFYFIDLDHFKPVNDLFDHSAGDKVLITIAQRLCDLVDESATVARLGGDEFIVFQRVPDTMKDDILAEKIRVSISQSHHILGVPAQVTASIGITKVKAGSFDQASKEADIAMYKIKHAKRNGFQFYSSALHREYMMAVNVTLGLKHAIKDRLLRLHYQPKVDLKTGEIMGVEALLRWTKNNPNQYGPAEFMPIIESTELIHDIGEWALEEACYVCRQWHKKGHKISIAVNVSAMQLATPDFARVVEGALRTSGLDPHYLELELTEHVLIKEHQHSNQVLKRLKMLGVCFAIDDFGTGYSNLGYLTHLKIDVLKLDRSFIAKIAHSKSTISVIKAIVGMAKMLKLKVIAEGIESEQEAQCLADIGCHIGQGYFWSQPMDNDALSKLLNNQRVLNPSTNIPTTI